MILSELSDLSDEKKLNKAKMKKYEEEKVKTLKKSSEKEEHLIYNVPEKLPKYSPKYNVIVDSVLSVGLSFVYTEYKTLEGTVLSKLLKANGFAPFLIKQNEKGEWLNYLKTKKTKINLNML